MNNRTTECLKKLGKNYSLTIYQYLNLILCSFMTWIKYTTFIVQLYQNKMGEDPIIRVISLS